MECAKCKKKNIISDCIKNPVDCTFPDFLKNYSISYDLSIMCTDCTANLCCNHCHFSPYSYPELLSPLDMLKILTKPGVEKFSISGSGRNYSYISKGEQACMKYLDKLGIKYEKQYKLKNLDNRLYDLYFEYNNKKYLLEFDGIQHFEKIEFFDMNQSLKERQKADIIKTNAARNHKYRLIRIDYTQIDKIEEHIDKALQSKKKLYLSTPEMYEYLVK